MRHRPLGGEGKMKRLSSRTVCLLACGSVFGLYGCRLFQNQSAAIAQEVFFSEEEGGLRYVDHTAWSPGGRSLAYQTASSGGHQPYWEPITIIDIAQGSTIDMDTASRRLLGGEPCVTGDGEMFWSPDGRLHFSVILYLDEREEFRELAYDPGEDRIDEVLPRQ
jgi:hypothetical protein